MCPRLESACSSRSRSRPSGSSRPTNRLALGACGSGISFRPRRCQAAASGPRPEDELPGEHLLRLRRQDDGIRRLALEKSSELVANGSDGVPVDSREAGATPDLEESGVEREAGGASPLRRRVSIGSPLSPCVPQRHRRERGASRRLFESIQAEGREDRSVRQADLQDSPPEGFDLLPDGFEELRGVPGKPALLGSGHEKDGQMPLFPAESRDGRRAVPGRLFDCAAALPGPASSSVAVPAGGRRFGENLMPLEAVAQRVACHAEHLRGPRDVPSRSPERLLEPVGRKHAHSVAGRRERPAAVLRGSLQTGRPRRPGSRGARGKREHLRRDHRPLREQGHALDHVRELADVAGPGVGQKRFSRVRREGPRRQRVGDRVPREEAVREEENVGAALAQRRQREGHDGEAVVEVFPKPVLSHGAVEVLAGGRQNPRVHFFAARASEPADRALLDHRQELRLLSRGQEPDLVEEERPRCAS